MNENDAMTVHFGRAPHGIGLDGRCEDCDPAPSPATEPPHDLREAIAFAVRTRPHYPPCDHPDNPCSCGAAEDRRTIAAELTPLLDRLTRAEAALVALTEAVSRGDEHGLPEAYRAACAALSPESVGNGAAAVARVTPTPASVPALNAKQVGLARTAALSPESVQS